MSQRNDSPHENHSSDDGAASSAHRAEGDGVPRIEAPRLVPAQDESRQHPAPSGDIITVPFEEAARESGYGHVDDDAPGLAAFVRARRFIPLAAAVAIAACVGALTGALTTAAVSRFADDAAVTATLRDDGRRLEDAMTKVSRDLAALKTNAEISAKSATVQMTRLNERLEKTDKAQAEAAAKVAKLADAIDRNTTIAARTAADPVVTGSIPTTVPTVPPLPARAQPAIVDGWVLRSVQNGTAVIQGRIGLVEVEPGDNLPGLGRIETIRRQDGRWVVVTSRGLVISR